MDIPMSPPLSTSVAPGYGFDHNYWQNKRRASSTSVNKPEQSEEKDTFQRTEPLTSQYPKPIPDPPEQYDTGFWAKAAGLAKRIKNVFLSIASALTPRLQFGAGINLFRLN